MITGRGVGKLHLIPHVYRGFVGYKIGGHACVRGAADEKGSKEQYKKTRPRPVYTSFLRASVKPPHG